jgi:hypothetical protein
VVNSSSGTDYTLASLTANSTYNAENISNFTLNAGASSPDAALADNLDGIIITLSDGSIANINLAPEPASLSLLALGGLALLGRRRRRC